LGKSVGRGAWNGGFRRIFGDLRKGKQRIFGKGDSEGWDGDHFKLNGKRWGKEGRGKKNWEWLKMLKGGS